MRHSLQFVLALALGGDVFAQAPTLTLTARTGVIREPFSDVHTMAEYEDGQVIVSDRVSWEFVLADFSTGNSRTLGRKGAGPNEYRMAGGVTRWRGDTLLGYDAFGSRLIRFAPGGVLAGTIPYPSRRGGLGFVTARGVDRAGRLYYDSPVLERPVIKRSKTALILRWSPGSDTLEKVGEYTDHDDFDHQFRYTPFPKRDVWVLGPDGRIGIVSVEDYRLRWFSGDKVVETGPPIPFVAVPVTDAERDAFRARKALEPMAGAVSDPAAPAQRTRIAGERARAAWGDTLFPARLPPFAENAALMAENGDIWVRRLGPASETTERVDILDAHGALRAVLRLPPRRRLLSLGRSGVYVLAIDDDGLQTLERYAYPSRPK